MRFTDAINERWGFGWQQVVKDTLTILVVLAAVAVAVLAVYGLFD